MDDVLLTVAAVGSSGLQHLRLGEWETFLDVQGGVAARFAFVKGHAIGHMMALSGPRPDEPSGAPLKSLYGQEALALLALLRQVAAGTA